MSDSASGDSDGVHPRGYWLTAEPLPDHAFDASLCAAVAAGLGRRGIRSVLDLGCGTGQYVAALAAAGFDVHGFDGNPNTPALSGGRCGVADLSAALDLGGREAVLCLEVGEHVPAAHEAPLLDNIASHATRLAVVSWAVPGQGGLSHVNCRDNGYVTARLAERGFAACPIETRSLRQAASLPWFRDTLLVFERAADPSVPPRRVVGVLSYGTHVSQQAACLETWAAETSRPSDVDVLFVVGVPGLAPRPEADPLRVGPFLHCAGPDGYLDGPWKIRALCRWARRHGVEQVLLCHDDTYVDLCRLRHLAVPGVEYLGCDASLSPDAAWRIAPGVSVAEGGHAVLGACAIGLLADRLVRSSGFDDLDVAATLAAAGIRLTHEPRLSSHPIGSSNPRPVLRRYLSAEEMRAVHTSARMA